MTCRCSREVLECGGWRGTRADTAVVKLRTAGKSGVCPRPSPTAVQNVGVERALPEKVNYAVKSSYLRSFLESVPKVSAKLKEPETKERKFEEVVKAAEQAAVLVLVY